jgi:hypothetical protein
MLDIFKYIKADQFFKDYCPEIKSYNHKMRGFNGRGNPTSFSKEEELIIKKAVALLFKDLKKK